jgi:hypothetical protein
VVLRQADGVHLQGQDQEQRHPLPLHLGQGHPPARQLWRRPRQVQVQPAAGVHGELLSWAAVTMSIQYLCSCLAFLRSELILLYCLRCCRGARSGSSCIPAASKG